MKNINIKGSFIFLIIIILTASTAAVKSHQKEATLNKGIKSQQPQVMPDFGKIPLYFIPNKGQVDESALFYAKASKYTLWLTKEGLVFDSLRQVKKEPFENRDGPIPLKHSLEDFSESSNYKRTVSRFIFLDTEKNPQLVPTGQTSYRVNHFKGNEISKWKTNIQTSKAVLYKELYENIDLKVYGAEKEVEYDWIVKPGARPEDIKFTYEAVKGTHINKKGNLIIATEFGEYIHRKPHCYQEFNEKRKVVEGNFKRIADNVYGFEIKKYDKDSTLYIDPVVLTYSTYLGGDLPDFGYGIGVDDSNFVYITGTTQSSDFPLKNNYQEDKIYGDAFVTKLAPTGNSLIYSTYLGGNNRDVASDIDIDNTGHAYIIGSTKSSDFPVKNAYQSSFQGGTYDAFVSKLSDSGESLVYSTYLGGGNGDYDFGNAIVVDNLGYAYATGSTQSSDFPTKNAFQDSYQGGTYDAFVAKLSDSGESLVYSTFLGGDDTDRSNDIYVDDLGQVYVTGDTSSIDFPVHNALMVDPGDSKNDAFVTKLSSGGDNLVYSTYLGGSNYEYGEGIKVNTSGQAYVAGWTASSDFPLNNPYQNIFQGGDSDAFVSKLSSTGDSLVYSTYLGGSGNDYAEAIDIDSNGCPYVTGGTTSSDFPTINPYQNNQGEEDVFFTKLSSSGSQIAFSSYLGGNLDEWGFSIAVDSLGNFYITGYTKSSDFPKVNAYQDSLQSQLDAFIAHFTIQVKDDLLGTWSGQGVYYRNSDTGSWVKMATSATQITAGDIDDDGIDDLIGIWPGQGGVWVKYSSSGSWALLSSTSDWIGTGDMNGDGRCDLLGTWSGQGVYYRNSDTGSWVKMATSATQITAGDIDGDGTDDLLGIWPSQGGVWVKYSSSGSWSKLSSTSDWIGTGDMNGDGRCDLLGTWTGQGVYYRDSDTGSWVKMATPATQLAAGDIDGDGTDDLLGIWPSQGGVWVKYSSDSLWEKLSSTADWIAAGKMRGGSSSSADTSLQALSSPVGGLAQGPESLTNYIDLSNKGPNGVNFTHQYQQNLFPQMTDRKGKRIPGPGEVGFKCTEQKNLVPKKIAERLKKNKAR